MEKKEIWFEAYFKYELDEDFEGPIDFDATPYKMTTKTMFPSLERLKKEVEGCYQRCGALEVNLVKCECTRDVAENIVNEKAIAMVKAAKEVVEMAKEKGMLEEKGIIIEGARGG